MRVEAGDADQHVWQGPEPVGAAGLRLKRVATATLGEIGGASDVAAAIMRLQNHPLGLELRRQTFTGWTVDGVPATDARLDEIECDPDRCQEPWSVMFAVWVRLGFLGSAPRRLLLEAEAKAAAAKAAASSPTLDAPPS